MKTCSTCRFRAAPRGLSAWSDDGDYLGETEHSTCTRILHGNGGDVKAPRVFSEPALVTDGSGYAARLVVLPSFGCSLHEDR